MELTDNIVLEADVVLEIFEHLGSEEVAIYVLIEGAESDVTVEQLATWSHLPMGRVKTICERLGMYQMGIQPPTD